MATGIDDQMLACEDCGQGFAVAASEQAFYRERGLPLPRRCLGCRARRRAERNAHLIASYDTRDNAPLSGRDLGLYPSGSGRGRERGTSFGPRQRYHAICADCGKDTDVPFMPRGDRPVYCRQCFDAQRGR